MTRTKTKNNLPKFFDLSCNMFINITKFDDIDSFCGRDYELRHEFLFLSLS